jgi:uncharacterized cysteine cluster protein YcgN (CxxCxxCC family)
MLSVKFDILMTVTEMNDAFWDVMSQLVGMMGTCCLHSWSRRQLKHMPLKKIGTFVPKHMASHSTDWNLSNK